MNITEIVAAIGAIFWMLAGHYTEGTMMLCTMFICGAINDK